MPITSCEMSGWMNLKLESRLLGEISITSHMQTIPPLWQRKQRGTKEPLDESERGEIKVGLRLNIQKMKIMASGPISSWLIDGGKEETVTDFIFLGSKITADTDCSYEIKRCLFLERKAMINVDRVLESRNMTLPTKVHLVKAMLFTVVMYECERWTIKKSEHWRIDAFKL